MATLTIPAGSRVYLDTNLLIYAVERIAPYEELVRLLFGRFDSTELQPVTSELSLAEVMVKPYQTNSIPDQQAYLSLFSANSLLEVVPIDRAILLDAAVLRAQQHLPLPDAIHFTTAVQSACDFLLTNDRRLKSLRGVQVLLLADYV